MPWLAANALTAPIIALAVGAKTGVLSKIPGSGWVSDVGGVFAEKMEDFAKTKIGFHILATISGGAVYGALLPMVGPFVVILTTATPGLLAGEDFTTAYTKGLLDSLAKLAFVMTLPIGGAGAAIPAAVAAAVGGGSAAAAVALDKYKDDIIRTINSSEFQAVVAQISAEAKKNGITFKDAMDRLGLTLENLSRRFNARQDVVAHGINANAHEVVFDPAGFDARTGVRYPPSGTLPPPLTLADVPVSLTRAEYSDLTAKAKADGRTPQDVLDALDSLFLIARARELAEGDLYKQWKITLESSLQNPGDRRLAETATALGASYAAIATPAQRLHDSRRALTETETERARKARRQPPVAPADLQLLDRQIALLRGEVSHNQRGQVLPITVGGELGKLGSIALVTSPLWGYALYRHRGTLLSMLRGILP